MIIDHFFVQQLINSEKVKADSEALERLQIISIDQNNQQIVKIPNFCFITCTNIFNMSM